MAATCMMPGDRMSLTLNVNVDMACNVDIEDLKSRGNEFLMQYFEELGGRLKAQVVVVSKKHRLIGGEV